MWEPQYPTTLWASTACYKGQPYLLLYTLYILHIYIYYEVYTNACTLWMIYRIFKGNSDYKRFWIYMPSLEHNPRVRCDFTVLWLLKEAAWILGMMAIKA
jgi:hypothetical protein